MEFAFYDAAGALLFVRSDAESARWVCEEMSLNCLFPYDPEKIIERGMRVRFDAPDGLMQLCEIRKVTSYEPDHYQEIVAEHICIAELTDKVVQGQEYIDQQLSTVLGAVLTGTGWEVGSGSSSVKSLVSSCNLSNTNVWAAVRAIESAWNVEISPRLTRNASGITHKYLDLKNGGTSSGLRITINKNAQNAGVTYDDSNVKTAVYGWGAAETDSSTDERTVLTFSDVVWTNTAAHPAKPAGQAYIEDPDATAAYGRNGEPRFGFYQNAGIDDPETLLQKSWEYLKTVREPQITIECTVSDLKRLGFTDAAIGLGHIAIVEVEPLGLEYRKQITKLTVDLLDPTQTQVTIGDIIPNIVYLAQKTNESATGGGGGGGQSRKDYELGEFHTDIQSNGRLLALKAWQTDVDDVNSILRQAGMDLDESGVLIYAEDNELNIASRISTTASGIRSEVANSLSGLVTYIDQQDNSIRQVITHTAHVYTQLQDPLSDEGGGILPAEGDMWIKDGDIHTWADAAGKTWAELSEDYEWRQLAGASGYVWLNGKWEPFVDHGGALLQGTRIDQTEEHIALQAGDIRGMYGELEVTSRQIRTELIDARNDLGSSITQTASQIRAEVHAQGSQLYSSIEQTATQIRAEVSDSLNSMGSSITQTASQIRSEVHSQSSTLYSAIEQTATQIRAEVADETNGLRSSITQTASQIRSEVSDTKNSLASSITQTASQIRAEVSDGNNSLKSTITQTASQIRSEVSDSNNSLASSITQTASQIRSEVSDTKNSLRSEIVQNSSQIALKVNNGDVATQLAVEAGNVRISGGNLVIDGYIKSDASYTGVLYGSAVSVTGNVSGGGTVSGADASFPNGTGTFNLVDANTVDTAALTVGLYAASWKSKTVVTGINKTSGTSRQWAYWNGSDYAYTLSQSFLTNVTADTTTIYYLGRS